jgi:hypothetical protein
MSLHYAVKLVCHSLHSSQAMREQHYHCSDVGYRGLRSLLLGR